MLPRSIFLLVTAFFLQSTALSAAGIQGYIRDTDGNALEYATIYVQETGDGAVTNSEGFYQLRLEPGNYTIIFQYLGFQSKVEKVAIGGSWKELNMSLSPQSYRLKEVIVSGSDEDPAYTVMRKAIAKAEYHRNQIDRYEAQVYVKGSGRLVKSPFFLRKRLAKEGIDSTIAFTSESVSIIEYERPNTFKERVISVYQQGEDNDSSPMQYVNGSFYQPEIAGAVSPLSPKAFGFYRFKLEGYFEDRGYLVNKIRVKPRSRGDDVFDGYIYIVEDYWAIHSLELSTYKLGIRFGINQVYTPIQEVAWMPVTAQFDVTGSIFGFGFEYNYLASLKDYDIELNPELPTAFEVIDEKLNKELAKEIEEIRKEKPKTAEINEKLSNGEEVTRKELRKLMREYEKEEQKQEEEPEVISNTTYTVDSNAYKQDSAFWSEIRPLPLTTYELKGYRTQDSLAQVERQKEEEAQIRYDSTGRRIRRKRTLFDNLGFVFQESWKLGEKSRLRFDGPLHDVQFNPLEGFNSTMTLEYQQGFKNSQFDLGVDGRYGFSWRRFNFRGYSELRTGDSDFRQTFTLEGGRYVDQFNGKYRIPEFLNTFYALMHERNFIHLYEKEYVGFGWTKKWDATASARFRTEWANRRLFPDFTTTQTWFPKDDRAYNDNIPDMVETPPYPNREKAFTIAAGIEVRPWQKYRIRNGERQAINRSSPTFDLEYRRGIAGLGGSQTNYDLLDFTYKQEFNFTARGKLDVRLNAGMFLNNDYVGLADFKHFPGNEIIFTTIDPVASFRMAPFYEFSTQDKYVAGHLHYQFRKFLFTHIWEVQLLGIKENVFVNYLGTPSSQNYMEVGYSIDNIFRVFRLEFVTSFQDFEYRDFGVRIGIASNLGEDGFIFE
jgi:ribosomal protein L19